MLLKDNKLFELPRLIAGSFSGMDRLEIPYNILILKDVQQRSDNRNIELICQAVDGPEQKRGWVNFITDNRKQKDKLYHWLLKHIGKDIETIYSTDFSFGGKDI
jgi:hypothetical protein